MSQEEELQDTLERLSRRLQEQEHDLIALGGRLDRATSEWQENSARAAATEEGKRIEESIRGSVETSVKSVKLTLGLVGAVVSLVLGGVGYLGLQTLVPAAVTKILGDKVDEEIKKVEVESAKLVASNEEVVAEFKEKSEARLGYIKEQFRHVSAQHRAIGENHLIVLQTDFGAESPYMGILKGAIYRSNEQARIDVITDEVEPFSVLDAAWTLKRAIRDYPENTIFVAITGNPAGELLKPVIVRTKNGFTLVGYPNGVFDLVARDHNHEKSYYVDWERFQDLREEQGRKRYDSTVVGTAEILGSVAGTLSLGLFPWEQDPDAKDPDKYQFKWDDIVTVNHRYSEQLKGTRVKVETEKGRVSGAFMEMDRFGNLTTNITGRDLDAIGIPVKKIRPYEPLSLYVDLSRAISEKCGGEVQTRLLSLPLAAGYEEVAKGQPVAVLDAEFVQLAVNLGNFATHYGVCLSGDEPPPIRVCMKPKNCRQAAEG